jgi:hypothetical protein
MHCNLLCDCASESTRTPDAGQAKTLKNRRFQQNILLKKKPTDHP